MSTNFRKDPFQIAECGIHFIFLFRFILKEFLLYKLTLIILFYFLFRFILLRHFCYINWSWLMLLVTCNLPLGSSDSFYVVVRWKARADRVDECMGGWMDRWKDVRDHFGPLFFLHFNKFSTLSSYIFKCIIIKSYPHNFFGFKNLVNLGVWCKN